MSDCEELIMLKALVAKQKEELEQKDKIIEKQDITIEKRNKRIEKQDKLIEQQNIRLENMMQALLHAKKKLFGASTEVTKQVPGQFNLFQETELLAEELFKEQKKITVPSHQRVARKPGVRAEMLAALPKEVEEYIINPEDTCSVCDGDLKVIGKKVVRTKVEFIPAKLKVVQIVQQVAKCTKCGTGENENPKDHFQKAAIPSPVLPHSIATASIVAQVMYQKFMMGVPLNRQERDWHRLGLILPRSNMSHWVIRCSEQWLTPIYDLIHFYLKQCQCLHMDETRIQCNKEEGRKASSDSFMWVIRSGAHEKITASYFYYSPSRSGRIAQKLLEGFRGYLTTDAFPGYNKVEGIKRNFCRAHVRRYFVESIPLDNRGKEIPGSKGAEGREFINLLFKLEKEMEDLSLSEKETKRQVASRAILDAFWSWVEETSAIATTNEKLTKALSYATNHRSNLETFLEDGRLPISNNLCEANIKPFATARRAWLFADTPKGATANAVLYTLVESAKVNGLNVYEYLKYLLKVMPDTDFYNNPELLDAYLPWREDLPQECRLKNIRKKEFR